MKLVRLIPMLMSLLKNPPKDRDYSRDERIILNSNTFDPEFYSASNPDVTANGHDPFRHFMEHGWREGRNPNRLFDIDWYFNHYPDVLKANINPLLHYVIHGVAERRNPGPAFDTEWYLTKYDDVRLSGLNPLGTFLTRGESEGREPHPTASAAKLVGPSLTPYEAWQSVNKLTARDSDELREELALWTGRLPRISLITPIYNTDPALFGELIEAVLGQIYEDWELCLVNDASPSAHVGPMLEQAATRDPRIRLKSLAQNGGISVATNAAVEMATGEYIAFLDHDDLIPPDCLAEFALLLANEPEIDMAYSDDDKIDVQGRRFAPQFKPDWSPVLLLTFMYMSHLFVVRRSIFRDLGGFRSAFDGSQDYDFALRASEVVRKVGHIPRILYHWRAVEGSTALSVEGKPKSLEAGRLAIEDALARRGFAGANAIHPGWALAAKVGMYEIAFPDDGPSICIIVPTKNGLNLIQRCVQSLARTTYRNFEVMIVDNESTDPATLRYLESVHGHGNIRVEKIANPDGKFNFARLNNDAVRRTDAEFVLFLNNDTEVISAGWLSQMMGYALMRDVGAVGARLYFKDGTIQHAGITHGHNEGLAGHAFRGAAPHDWGYLGLVRASRECAGVTAACLLTRRSLFLDLGGFDEDFFAVSYNDADFCFRMVESGKSCVYACNAELYHYEGKSRGFSEDPRERLNYRLRYSNFVDRWYNPNLSLENENFSPATIRQQSRRAGPVRILGITNNLNNEGAPTTFLDLCVGMKKKGFADPVILSPADGPLREAYEAAGIKVIIAHSLFHGVKDRDTMEAALGGLATLFRALDVEVIIANTLQTFWGILGARQARLPAIWCQHESEEWTNYYDYLPVDMRAAAYQGFAYAYRVLYVADATRRAWRALETRGNFEVVRHGIPPERLAAETQRWSRKLARATFDVADDQLCISVLGTVCRRKGQLDVVEALRYLPPELVNKLTIFIAGHIAEADYGRQISDLTQKMPGARVVLTGRVEDPFVYYALTDIALCTSRFESAPRVLVEAMACGLPILTTPVFGIPEIVRENVNALFYDTGNAESLAHAIELLANDPGRREKLAHNSPLVLAGQPGFEEMVDKYNKAIREAINLEYL